MRKITEMLPGKIGGKELKRKMDWGDDFALVDARDRDSYGEEHIEGAMSLPVDQVEQKAEQMLGKDREVVVYCEGFSCAASGNEVRKLKKMGFKKLRHYAGGISQWKEFGYPIEGR